MNSRTAVFLCLMMSWLVQLSASDKVSQLNTIVIFTDDHGFSDLGCQDLQKDLKTPHIDALAASGVRMTSGYVTAPQCVPSRAGLLAGRSQNRFGVESNGMSLDGFNAQQTIAERLKEAGYATGMAGKWHLGPPQEIGDHGFDDVYHRNSGKPAWSNFRVDGSDGQATDAENKFYHLDANSAAACAFVERHKDEPFFFYCAYRAPHVPLDAPKKYLSRFPGKMPERRRQALAMIAAVDDGVGEIVSTLKRFDLMDRTMIWVIGDNGAPLKIHKADLPGGGPGWDGSLNEPLNGEKGMLSEGGIRVPFLVSWPGGFKGGREYDSPVVSLDVAATALALAGQEPDPELDGVNLIPYLKGEVEGAPHETLYWRWVAQAAARSGKWKYLRGGAREYLFDLDADREEKHNLIDQHPKIAAGLAEKLTTWSSGLQPAGLETKAMSTVWESYFDFYLDGKPAPPLRDKFKSTPNQEKPDDSVQGWLGRNARLKQDDSALVVSPKSDRPFLVINRLQIPPDAQVNVDLRSSADGQVAVQWRESGQKDFNDVQIVRADVKAASDFASTSLAISGKQSVIHVRLLLPTARVDVRSVSIVDSSGKSLKKWQFGRSRQR